MKSVIMIILGFFLLIKGADTLVKGSSNMAYRLKISDIVIGLTIVSIGTSLPELIISIKSSISGYSEISIGNILGSCICNILLIAGASCIFQNIHIDMKSRNTVLPLTLISMVLIYIFGNINLDISQIEGIFLLMFFVIFIIYIIWDIKYDDKNNFSKNTNVFKDILFIIMGIIGLKLGGDFVVEEASNIARYFNIQESVIGLTIVSIGTSLPELITSIVATRSGNSTIAFGNIIGSNLFNLLFVLGITSSINPIMYKPDFNSTLIILFLITILILLFDKIGKSRYLTKSNGFIMLLIYIDYMVALFKKI